MARIKISHLKNSQLLQDSFLRELTDVELGTLVGGGVLCQAPAFKHLCSDPPSDSDPSQSDPSAIITVTTPGGDVLTAVNFFKMFRDFEGGER